MRIIKLYVPFLYLKNYHLAFIRHLSNLKKTVFFCNFSAWIIPARHIPPISLQKTFCSILEISWEFQ